MVRNLKLLVVFLGGLLIIGVLVWQGIVFAGVPQVIGANISTTAAILGCGVLVFREGLEAILVLAAIAATVSKASQKHFGRGVGLGVALGLIATTGTWFLVVAILSSVNLPELDIQAATGLLAIAVLLLVMNWFFHKLYWTGWITMHTKKGKELIKASDDGNRRLSSGFVFLGLTATYREGFEVVLFLQQLRLRDGIDTVMIGAAIGLLLTSIVAILTFFAHEKLPYRKMLVFTGMLLGVVLLVMVGESIQEMQQAMWIPATSAGLPIPKWMGMWFAVFPNFQGLGAQAVAGLLVLGSYFMARRGRKSRGTSRDRPDPASLDPP